MRLPAPEWLLDYRKAWLARRLVAGLTAAAVVIPKALAYATVAGLPVQVGLYTALVPMVIYALLGTSRALSVSTTTTIAILTGVALGQVAPVWRSGGAHRGRRARSRSWWAPSCPGGAAAPGLRCQFHLGAGAGRFQGGHRPGHRAGPDPEAARASISTRARSATTCWRSSRASAGVRADRRRGDLHGGRAAGHRALASPRWPAPLVAVAVGIAAVGVFGLDDSHGVATIGSVPTGLPP